MTIFGIEFEGPRVSTCRVQQDNAGRFRLKFAISRLLHGTRYMGTGKRMWMCARACVFDMRIWRQPCIHIYPCRRPLELQTKRTYEQILRRFASQYACRITKKFDSNSITINTAHKINKFSIILIVSYLYGDPIIDTDVMQSVWFESEIIIIIILFINWILHRTDATSG